MAVAVQPELPPARSTFLSFPWRWRGLAWLLILGTAALRFWYLTTELAPDLAPDEAHYWDWSRHPDWSYYSKGPLVAWLIGLSCWLFEPLSESLTGHLMLAIRLPAIVCGALTLAGLYVLTALATRREGLALTVVMLALTFPLVAAGSLLMTIDSPYVCCWAWALVFGWLATFGQGNRQTGRTGWAWPVLGIVVGLGILAKYTMVLWLLSLALFLLFTPRQRQHLGTPGPWLAAGLAACCCLPILWWNWQHDWVTLRHVSGQAGLGNAGGWHWSGPFHYLSTQLGILLGGWFIVWAWAMFAHAPWRDERPGMRYLWWLSLPTFLVFLGFSLKNGGGEPNWPVTAYLSGLVLAAAGLTQQMEQGTLRMRRLVAAFLLTMALFGLTLTLLLHHTPVIYPLLANLAGLPSDRQPLPVRRFDPTCRLRGWRTLAREVDAVRARLQSQGLEPVLAAGFWNVPGELGVYCAGRPTVYCLGLGLGQRWSQYELWRPNPVLDPESFRGRTFLHVGEPEPALLSAFAKVDPPLEVEHRMGPYIVARWKILICHGYRGFPEDRWRTVQKF